MSRVQRPCDAIYDPAFTYSSALDLAREIRKGFPSSQKPTKREIFCNLFGEVKSQNDLKKIGICQDSSSRVTDISIDLAERAEIEKLKKKFLAHYSTLGVLRARFHAAPNAKFNFHMMEAYRLNEALDCAVYNLNTFHPSSRLSGNLRDRGTQTQYRESETQTDPYSPEYIVPTGKHPRILMLANLTFGKGLPAGQREVELLERAEQRSILEIQLENLPLNQQNRLRNKVELEEWRHRAREIEALQEIRLQVIAQLLRNREENRQEIVTRRLDRLWNRRQKEKSEVIEKIHAKYASAVRKMLCAIERKHKLTKPDKIELYSQPGSNAFAPLTRLGVFPDRGAERFKVSSHFLDTYSGLLELEKFIPGSMIDTPILVKKPLKYSEYASLRRRSKWQAQLQSLQKYMESLETKNTKPSKPLRFLFKIEKPAPRPSTPSMPDMNKLEDARNVAVMHLQRLIRGRAIQTMMYEARRKRQLLINELRSTHALTKDERAEKRRQMLTIRTNQTRYAYLQHEDSLSHEVLERLDSTVLGSMLDLLSKELDRLIVDQRLSELAERARNERRIRETEELSRRQWEERRRREQDEFFRQIVKVHQDTVDGYYSALIDSAMEASAELKATDEFEKIAELWPEEVRCAERHLTHEEEAAELVHNFLIPEVNRRYHREMVQRGERKYLSAAHGELFKEVESGGLSAEIRHYQGLRQDQATSTTNMEMDEEEEEADAQEELTLRYLRGQEYDCED